jgi:hypothetical protein
LNRLSCGCRFDGAIFAYDFGRLEWRDLLENNLSWLWFGCDGTCVERVLISVTMVYVLIGMMMMVVMMLLLMTYPTVYIIVVVNEIAWTIEYAANRFGFLFFFL